MANGAWQGHAKHLTLQRAIVGHTTSHSTTRLAYTLCRLCRHCVTLREWFDYRGHVCMVRIN